MFLGPLLTALLAVSSPSVGDKPSSSVVTYSGGTSARYGDLLAWVDSFSDAYVSPNVEIKPSTRPGGFGAFATTNIAKDELLFSVPRDACVTVSDATSDDDCGEALTNLLKKAGPGGTTVALAGYLAKEYLKMREIEAKVATNNKAGGQEGTTGEISALSESFDEIKFAPYIRTLPWERGVNEQEHVLFWPEEDIENYLLGSLCYSESVALRDEVQLGVKVLQGLVGPAVREARGERTINPLWTLLPWEKDTATTGSDVRGLEEAVVGAFVTILTRSFTTDVFEERLVPLLDMLQHSDTSSVTHASNDAGGVEVRAAFDIKAGDEIYNRYQKETDDDEEKMPRYRFFTRFGFVPGATMPVRQMLAERNVLFFPKRKEI